MRTTKQPLVSVIVPSYNSDSFLGLTLISLLEQTLRNIEIIVVDDCSTDTTESLLKWACKKYKRVTYVKNDSRKGAAYCRNKGNALARAKYIMVCDAGDACLPNRAKIQYTLMKNNPEIDCTYTNVVNVNAFEEPVDLQEAKHYYGKWGEKPSLCHPTMMYKRSAILEIPYTELCLHSDLYENTVVKWGRAGKKFRAIRDVLVYKMRVFHKDYRDLKAAYQYKARVYKKWGLQIPVHVKAVVEKISNSEDDDLVIPAFHEQGVKFSDYKD